MSAPQCNYIATGNTNVAGWHEFICTGCGTRVYLPTLHVVPRGNCNPALAAQHRAELTGPGTELHKLIEALDMKPTSSCDCAAMIARMNAWGPDGCEANLVAIVEHLRNAYGKLTWTEVMKARVLALTTGLALQVNWLDPIPSLVRLAIGMARSQIAPGE